MKRIVNINGKTKEEVLISKLEIENRDLKRQITELNQALQLQQTGVNRCFSIGKVVIIEDCIHGHEFENGEEVLITDYDSSNGSAHWLCKGKNWSWWISEDEARLK